MNYEIVHREDFYELAEKRCSRKGKDRRSQRFWKNTNLPKTTAETKVNGEFKQSDSNTWQNSIPVRTTSP